MRKAAQAHHACARARAPKQQTTTTNEPTPTTNNHQKNHTHRAAAHTTKQGFDLAENDGITLVKQVKYRGQVIEAAWPLGAAIDDLSSAAAAAAE